jgi:Tfp pilus assembly protein PilZ
MLQAPSETAIRGGNPMQTLNNMYERRQNRGFSNENDDDLDLDQHEDAPRRRFHRLPLRLWTEGRMDDRLDFHNCSNLSEEGMFIESPEPYDCGVEVTIEFNLPGIHDAITVQGTVVSALTEESPGENIMGNGFRFDAISSGDRALIRAYIGASARIG